MSVLEREHGGDLAVPHGDPDEVRLAARRIAAAGERAAATAGVRGEARAELGLVWSGPAADLASAELDVLAARGRRALTGLTVAAAALVRHAEALEVARARAAACARRAAAARDAHLREVAALRAAGLDAASLSTAVSEANERLSQALRAIHRDHGQALDELMASAARCARVLGGVTGALPTVPGGGGQPLGAAVAAGLLADLPLAQARIHAASQRPVGHLPPRDEPDWLDASLQAAAAAGAWTWNHTAVPLVNGAADVVEAMAEHPEHVVEVAAGAALTVLGAGGEVGGVALDATGVGAVAGVPLNLAAAGAIASGVSLAGTGAKGLLDEAARNDNRLLHEADGSSAPARGRPGDPLPDSLRPDVAGSTWSGRVARNGHGEVWQDPSQIGRSEDALSVRVMDPMWRYENGYVRFYDEKGRPLTLDGVPGPNKHESTHVPIRPDGTYDIPRGWTP